MDVKEFIDQNKGLYRRDMDAMTYQTLDHSDEHLYELATSGYLVSRAEEMGLGEDFIADLTDYLVDLARPEEDNDEDSDDED